MVVLEGELLVSGREIGSLTNKGQLVNSCVNVHNWAILVYIR